MIEDELRQLEQRKEQHLPALLLLRDMALDGRHIQLPLMNRRIPLITDSWAKPELGSGCVKITPAHDPNDYDVWSRHKDRVDAISILDPSGVLNSNAGFYAGLTLTEARKQIVEDLDKQGLVERIEQREIQIGHSDRSKTPIEPLLSDQWFVRMGDVPGGVTMGRATKREHQSAGLVQSAIDAVDDGRVSIHPSRYAKTYRDWLVEKRDWPISRQLWWGHQIPVWSKRGACATVDLTPLANLIRDGKDVVSVRVHFVDRSASEQGALFVDEATCSTGIEGNPDEMCSIDVCLLSDDPERVEFLQQHGYVRDPDVLDTWFSSALWPHSTLGWPDPSTAEQNAGQTPLAGSDGIEDCLSYYYPGSCLVTGRDIITLWVARMVIAGLYNLGDVPFSDVFIHANILDGKGERMSKSKGNGIDPVDIIEQYGTDAMRYVLCDMQTGTQDIRLPVTAICPSCDHENDLTQTQHGSSVFTHRCSGCSLEFDVLGSMPNMQSGKLISKRFEVGRAFCNKLWNSARFVFMCLDDKSPSSPFSEDSLQIEDRWILDGMTRMISSVSDSLSDYNPSQALNAAREFFWGDFCDWYLELIKPRLAQSDESADTARACVSFCFDQVLRILHPFVPFITEHLWKCLDHVRSDRSLGGLAPALPSPALATASFPVVNDRLLASGLREIFDDLRELTRAVREARQSAGISPKKKLNVTLRPPLDRVASLKEHGHVVAHLAGVNRLVVDTTAKRTSGSVAKAVGDLEVFVHDVIDDAEEKTRLEKELQAVGKEIGLCERKLANPKFVDRAPEDVVNEQRKRLARYEAARDSLARSLEQLKA